jgi:hypothetical protein
MLAKARFYLFCIMLAILSTQSSAQKIYLKQKIYLNGKEIKYKTDQLKNYPGIATDKDEFIKLIKRGENYDVNPLRSSPSVGLLVLPDPAGNTSHVFQVRLTYKNNDQNRRVKEAEVEELLQFTPENIDIDANKLKDLGFEDLQVLCGAVDNIPRISFQLIAIAGFDSTANPPGFFDGIYVARNPCDLSSVVRTSSQGSLPLTPFNEYRIRCLPDNFHGRVLIKNQPNGDTTWFSKPAKPAPKAGSAVPKLSLADTLSKETFNLPCDAKHDFLVNLYRNKKGTIRKVGVINLAAKKKLVIQQSLNINAGSYPVADYIVTFTLPAGKPPVGDSVLVISRQAFPGSPIDTVLAISLSKPQSDYTIETADGKDRVLLKINTGSVEKDNVTVKKAAVAKKKDSVTKKNDSVTVKRDSVTVRRDSVTVRRDSVPVRRDSIPVKKAAAPVKKDPVTEKKVSSISFSLFSIPEDAYNYDGLFNSFNFEQWLGIRYRGVPAHCAGEMAYEVHLHDTIVLRYALFGASAVDTVKKAKDTTAKAKAGPVKPGSVAILPSPPFTLSPSSTEGYMPVHLQLPMAAYDSSACKVPFKMKFGTKLSNHFHPADSSVTISKEDWDSAISFNQGKLWVDVAVKYDSTTDTLQREQEDYLVINDSIQRGRRTIQLRNYNPNSAFWLEVGSNFELLNGLSPQNIYAGVIMFAKDIGAIKGWNFSIIGGAYESLTSSSASSSDSGIVYRDNSSYTFSAANQGFPVYHDTGSVTVTSVTRNIGLIFEPAVRLTDRPAKLNGAHVFASLYTELLWQTVTTSTDYSKLFRDASQTQYVDPYMLYKYRFKQDSSAKNDFRSYYFGLGMPLYLKRNSFTYFVNPNIGITNQKFTPVRPYADPRKLSQVYEYPTDSIPSGYPVVYLQPRRSWNPFLLVQFRFNEEKYDISITGEVRTLLLRNSSPLITLTISKKFDLGNLIKTVLAPAKSSD